MEFNRRRFFSAFSILGLVGLIYVFFNACNDRGIEPDFFKGTVRGVLKMNTPDLATTDEMRVVLAKNFPFEDLQSLIISARLKPRRDIETQNIPYEISAPLGVYDAALVIWKAIGESINITDIVGIYGNLSEFELTSIVLTEEQPIADSVDITVDLSRVNRTSRIQGQIDFVGDWPSNTQIVALVMYRNFSELGTIPPALVFVPNNVEQFVYEVRVPPGTYRFVFVAWLPQGEFDLGNIRVLGTYEDPDMPGQAGTIIVPDSTTITGINITADFANVN